MIDAMTAPATITAIRQYHSAPQLNQPAMQQLQPTVQPNQPALQQHHASIQPNQPANQLPQPEVQQHHARFNRPTVYSKTIVRVQGFQRTEEQVNRSVGTWKKTLQDEGRYLPEAETLDEGQRESYLKQLSSALRNHFAWWVSYTSEGLHEDRHSQFKWLQATFNTPRYYENPDRWLHNQQQNAKHCLTHRCVSIWWYYDQAMRDIPGFQDNSGRHRSTVGTTTRTSQPESQPDNQPSWGTPPNQPQQPRYTSIQENIADAAERQRQLALHHRAPEPHDDMVDLDEWDIHYDDLMAPEQRNQVVELQHEIRRIKSGHPSKVYMDRRTFTINTAEALRQVDASSTQIPTFLFNVKTPWSSGYGQANIAYDQSKISTYEQKIAQLRNINAQVCQMEISSSKNGPAGQGDL